MFDAEGHDVPEFDILPDSVLLVDRVKDPVADVDDETRTDADNKLVKEPSITLGLLVIDPDTVMLIGFETVPESDGEEVVDEVLDPDLDGEVLLVPVASNAVALEVSETE